jgi:hypothetical protein
MLRVIANVPILIAQTIQRCVWRLLKIAAYCLDGGTGYINSARLFAVNIISQPLSTSSR